MPALEKIHPFFFVLVATILEVCGDKLISTALHNQSGAARIGFMIVGAALLFGYGFFLNLTPVEFGRIVGIYIATLFVVWQAITYLTTRAVPPLPVIVGGALIVSGGLIVTFWRSK